MHLGDLARKIAVVIRPGDWSIEEGKVTKKMQRAANSRPVVYKSYIFKLLV
jgi:hypothetical protein